MRATTIDARDIACDERLARGVGDLRAELPPTWTAAPSDSRAAAATGAGTSAGAVGELVA